MLRERLMRWRKEESSVVRVDKPTNLPRAKSLGYKAKQGVLVARVHIRKGSGMHTKPSNARRPKRMGISKLTRRKSIQSMAEERAARKYPNCEVLNSYWVGEDGQNKFFEVILVDRTNPSVMADVHLMDVVATQHKGRVFRGLTSAGKRGRGLHNRGRGAEKARPSLRAHGRMLK
ncbi:MAG: 50S ribosomal protein L15e [Candidatus Diapherotrites archaeon]|nr:50S ribosomal protein L15e [Candidatus Diapherotrites archaeon]